MRKTSGLSLLLLIFLSLCLVTFSLLSVSESSADLKLSQKSAQHTSEYYSAVSNANATLAAVDTVLLQSYASAESASDSDTDSMEAYFLACKETASIPGVSWEQTESDRGTVSFLETINENQSLFCELSVHFPIAPEDPFYSITAWKIVHTASWTADTSQNLYQFSTE